ncbi:MAG: TetR/AcrR family transcriptional regulator [Mycobacterium sp.]|nr:TetR/AcrR family transcriptional regulator [Mycobacterium sp.]
MPRRIDVDAVLAAAVSVFAEKGYRTTTTKEIAERAGVNEVTLFRRYGGKAALINAALARVLEDSAFGRLTATEDVTADLIALVHAYGETTQQYGGLVVTLLAETAHQPDLREALPALMPNLLKAAQVIAHHQDHQRLAPGNPMQKLVMLLAPLMMFGMWSRAGAPAVLAELEPHAVVAAFLDGHRARARKTGRECV